MSHAVIIIDPITGEKTTTYPSHDGPGGEEGGNRAAVPATHPIVGEFTFPKSLKYAKFKPYTKRQSERAAKKVYADASTTRPEIKALLDVLFEGKGFE